MLLATQCPHCFTSFRVANDQLKLHAGLVRCGSCQQTFNGIEYLLAPGAKPALPPTITPVVAAVPLAETHVTEFATSATFTPIQVAIPEIGQTKELELALEIDAPVNSVENATLQGATTYSTQDQNLTVTSQSTSLEFDLGDDIPATQLRNTDTKLTEESGQHDQDEGHGDSLMQISLFNAEDGDITLSEPAPAPNLPEQEHDVLGAERNVEDHKQLVKVELDAPVKAWNAVINIGAAKEGQVKEHIDLEKPDFVIQAEKKQRRSRIVRASMILFSTLLFFALLSQSVYVFRNHIAGWLPQTKPVLQEVCKLLQCRIELPTQIEAISIESNELQALSNEKNIFSLAIQLQNKSGTLQAWPMLELILNDAKDSPVVQRVFTPADYLTNKNDLIKGIGANSEQTIKLYFELSGPKASGYHVGVFYP